jgi:hypothetical protein
MIMNPAILNRNDFAIVWHNPAHRHFNNTTTSTKEKQSFNRWAIASRKAKPMT